MTGSEDDEAEKKNADGTKGDESKSEEVFKEKDNQEHEEQLRPRWSVTSSSCIYTVSSRMTLSSSVPQWLNFATGVVDSRGPSLDNRLGAVQQNKISP